MVDGIGIGEVCEVDTNGIALRGEFFRNAELLCLLPETRTKTFEPEGEKIEGCTVFAIYDNKIVTSFLADKHQRDFWEVNRDKTVVVERKPYILNGELNTHFNHQNL